MIDINTHKRTALAVTMLIAAFAPPVRADITYTFHLGGSAVGMPEL